MIQWIDVREISQKTMDLCSSKTQRKDSRFNFPFSQLSPRSIPMPQDLGIARATFLPLTLHEAEQLGTLAVELLGEVGC